MATFKDGVTDSKDGRMRRRAVAACDLQKKITLHWKAEGAALRMRPPLMTLRCVAYVLIMYL